MDEQMARLLAGVRLHENPVSPERIAHAERALAVQFPDDYKALLCEHDGGMGRVGAAPLELWRLDELVARNQEAAMARALPGFVVFADDCGAEAYAFWCKEGCCTRVGRIGELAASEHQFEPMGDSFADFLRALSHVH
jgi:cell wall assembly regulator SMI1